MTKNILLSTLLASSLVLSANAESFTMSAADKAMYEELKENNPADLEVDAGSELIEEAVGDEEGLAKFFGIKTDDLPKYIATFPRYMEQAGKVVGLDQALQMAMVANGVKPYKLTSGDMISLFSYVKSLGNDEKINVDINANDHMKEAYALGKKMWDTKRGTRGLSCANCHEAAPLGAADMILRTQQLPMVSSESANSMGTWPAYRMKKSKVVTLQGRFKQCMNNSMQAKIPEGSAEMVALEVYVANLNKGMALAIPGLKR